MSSAHYQAPLPKSVRDRLDMNTHPGLELDKYARSWGGIAPPAKLSEAVQQPTIARVVSLSQAPPLGLDFAALVAQRDFSLRALDASRLRATTVGPLTLHLSRASALENAGICLHRIYGFTYLPATGLKGLTQAYAKTIWLPAQADTAAAQRRIDDVFGRAPEKAIRRTDAPRQKASEHQTSRPVEQAGRVIFHDAWPMTWPRLQSDILNSHHVNYYTSDNDKVAPPGDWEEPVPVYFLSAPAGITFDLALSARRPNEDRELVEQARQWLAAALQDSGAGAKTNSGYGAFRVEGVGDADSQAARDRAWRDAEQRQTRCRETFALTLKTPAFLAGADAEDSKTCDLRSASLRGQLRWWWRTLHAGHLSPADLRRLESAIWGDTKRGGAVRITVSRMPDGKTHVARPFDRLQIVTDNKLPPPPNRKTTQGLTYFTYGMDERKEGRLVRRHYLEPGAAWQLSIAARPSKFVIQEVDKRRKLEEVSKPLTAEQVIREATAALELLCRLGGVGAKCRKGFGGFAAPTGLSSDTLDSRLTALKSQSHRLRESLGLKRGKSESPSLDELLLVPAIPTPWKNYWMALDQIGDAAQAFAQSRKHHLEKKALGLPRNVRPPYTGTFRAGTDVSSRHASPIGYHLEQNDAGAFVVRIFAFPAARLPTLEKSREFLRGAITEIQNHLIERTQRNATVGRQLAIGPAPPAPPPSTTPAAKVVKVGDWVLCRLPAEKTKAGGWKATYGGQTGPIQNSGDVPTDKKPGDEVTLIVRIAKPTEIAFRWPTPADHAVRDKSKKR